MWVTDFLGVDALYGAFVAGITVPREHGSGSYYAKTAELYFFCYFVYL